MKTLQHRSILVIILLSCIFIVASGHSQQKGDQLDDLIMDRFIDDSGEELLVINIDGKPPDFFLASSSFIAASAMSISNVPAYDWSFGCSPTSASMMRGLL